MEGEGGVRTSEGSTADTARKRPERPWTSARTMEVLRRCSLATAQRLVHRAVAVSTALNAQVQTWTYILVCASSDMDLYVAGVLGNFVSPPFLQVLFSVRL